MMNTLEKIVITGNGRISGLHRERLEKALAEIQKRCSARIITAENVINAVMEAEKRLRELSTAADAIGTRVEIDIHAQNFPKAYTNKYIPESTYFSARREKSAWIIESIGRGRCSRSGNRISFSFTEETKKHMWELVRNIA